MARIRTIKPDTASSGSLNRCSVEAELMFIKSWCFFDDDGVHAADPLQLKMQVYPGRNYSEEQIQEWIDQLVAEDCLAVFEVPATDNPSLKHHVGKKFWICVNWHHQSIQHPTPVRAPIREAWRTSRGEIDVPDKFGFRAPHTQGKDSPAMPGSPDAAVWEQVFRRATHSFKEFNMADVRKPQDRNLALKVCYLVLSGQLREEWLTEAVKSMKKSQAKAAADKKAFRPGALLTQIFKNKCSEAKPPLDFRRLLAECPEPPSKEAPSAAPPSPPPAAAPVAVDVAALAGAAVKGPPAPDKKPAQSGAEIARQLRQLEAEDRRLA